MIYQCLVVVNMVVLHPEFPSMMIWESTRYIIGSQNVNSAQDFYKKINGKYIAIINNTSLTIIINK